MADEFEALLERARGGDAEAFQSLLERHMQAVHAFVRMRSGALIRERESSVDIVQSVCRDVIQKIDLFRHGGETGFRQWLFTNVVRKIANRNAHYHAQKRDAGREVGIGRDSDSGQGLLDVAGGGLTPSRELMAREEAARIEEAFAALPEDYREVIALSRIAGLPHAEIAEKLGKTEGATRKLLARALRTLAEKLDS